MVIFEGFWDKDKSAVPLVIMFVGSDKDSFLLLFTVEFLADVEGVVAGEDSDKPEDPFVNKEVSETAPSFLWSGEGCLAAFNDKEDGLISAVGLRGGEVTGDWVCMLGRDTLLGVFSEIKGECEGLAGSWLGLFVFEDAVACVEEVALLITGLGLVNDCLGGRGSSLLSSDTGDIAGETDTGWNMDLILSPIDILRLVAVAVVVLVV